MNEKNSLKEKMVRSEEYGNLYYVFISETEEHLNFHEVRALVVDAEFPIIAMTANAFDEGVQRSLQAGMIAHLTKPIEMDRLYETLGELIR